MKKDSDFLKRREEVACFNKKHKWVKRGISMTHCRSASLHLELFWCEETRLRFLPCTPLQASKAPESKAVRINVLIRRSGESRSGLLGRPSQKGARYSDSDNLVQRALRVL